MSESRAAATKTSSSSSGGRRRGLPERVRMRADEHFVEELTSRNEEQVGRRIALSSIEPDADQPRESIGELSELVASIREKGVLEPVLVRPHPERKANYLLISGERRYRAALEAGLFEVPAIEMDVSAEEALEIALIENLQRKDLTPFEEAEGFRALAERHGYTHEQVATAVGKSRSAVTETLGLLQMPSRVREAAKALGIQSKSVLLEAMKAGDPDDMLALLERAATLGLSRDDLRKELKRRKAASSAKRGRRTKPYVFKFKSPDKRFSLALSFRQSEVDHDDLIGALEQILDELRTLQDQQG